MKPQQSGWNGVDMTDLYERAAQIIREGKQMTKLREELTVEDLISVTRAIRILRPDLIDSVCVGVEQPQIGDKNVVFHMKSSRDKSGERDECIVMVSADLILEQFGGTGNVANRGV
jgi:hypothetical protein